MNSYSGKLNAQLVDCFRSVLKVEEKSLGCLSARELSVSEFHLLEAVGRGGSGGKKVSEIAQALGVTMPSVTVAIGKLEKKGYLRRTRCGRDARVVNVSLTRSGRRMNSAHRYFHEQMVRSFLSSFSEEEKDVILRAVTNLNTFLAEHVREMDTKERATALLPTEFIKK